MSEEYSGFDLTLYNLFTLLREMYYTRGETETNFLLKSGGTVAGSLTIQGNLVVNGQSYSIDTENLKVGDYTITLAKDNEQTLTSMVGMVVPKYDGTNYGFFGWDADGYAYVGDLTNYDGTSAITLANNSSLQRISTIDTTNTVVASNGVIYVYDATSHCFKKPTNDNKYYVIRNGAFVETELFTEQKSKNISNALYNLGAFDSVSGNTITRKTKYFVLTGAESWTWSNSSGMWYATINGLVDGKNLVCSNGIVAVCYSDNQIRVYASSNPTITSSSNLNEIFNNGTRLEQELDIAYQYQDTIIENQPLLNLDSNGCNFLREEWEKGLNLANYNARLQGIQINGSNGSLNSDSNYYTIITEVKPNTTYTITSAESNMFVALYNGTPSTSTFIQVKGPTTITTTSTTKYIGFTVSNSTTDCMMVEANHPYPYSDFNQKEHITNDEATLLKKEEEKCRNLCPTQEVVVAEWSVNLKERTTVKPNTTYTISAIYSGDVLSFVIGLYNGTTLIQQINSENYAKSYTFTTPSNCDNILIKFGASSYTATTYSITNIMLVEGSEAEPYQAYNGAIVHKGDIEPVLLWENSSPNSSFTGQTLSNLPDMSGFKYIVIEYKFDKSSSQSTRYLKLKYGQGQYADLSIISSNASATNISTRYLRFISITSIEFGDCYINQSLDNEKMIPTAIYGTNVL